MARVLIIASFADSLVNFRGDLILHILNRGHQVVTAAPGDSAATDQTLSGWGVRRIKINLQRTGLDPLADLRLVFELYRVARRERPDVVLAYTIKPVVYGMFAARLAGVVRCAALITGLGFAFSCPINLAQRFSQGIARCLYWIGMRNTDTVFFQNPDDEAAFRSSRLISRSQHVVLTSGSGVNLERFRSQPRTDTSLQFLMIARLLIEKGVREYIKAAAVVRKIRPELTFHLVGPFDEHPSSITQLELRQAQSNGDLIYHGPTDDVRPFLAACHIFVLPSYREGTPRSVLEAMAVGRPIITSDAPGCRETVIEGFNGFLVKPKDVDSLSDAFVRMSDLPREKIVQLSNNSRSLAESRFDVRNVNATIISSIGL